MLEITFKNGNTVTYKPESFTDYSYQGAVFVVIKDSQWIGIYSMDMIAFIEYKEA
jgi:hypothetical protein